MAGKSRAAEAKLARLRQLRDRPSSPELLPELRTALVDSLNIVVAEAAGIAGTARLTALMPELLAAYDHFMTDPLKRDRNCTAKIAIVEALDNLEYDEAKIFLEGIKYIQMEPVWGGREDSAAPLRCVCAAALVRINHPDVLSLLIDLLMDDDQRARIGAAYSLASSGKNTAMHLLRLKARMGDVEPEVTAECLNGLLRLAPHESLSFVAEFLQSPDVTLQEATLLALGSSRLPEAFDVLKQFWDGSPRPELQETVLLAVGLLRLPVATEFLLSLVAEGQAESAAGAVSALAIFRHDTVFRERVAALVATRNDRDLQQVFLTKFCTAVE